MEINNQPINIKKRNLIGSYNLYKKEVLRFVKVYNQTIIAPIVNSLLLLAIFTLAFNRGDFVISGIPYIKFIAAGLIMSVIMQNSFANTSSTITISKILGHIIDLIIVPIYPSCKVIAIILAGVTRGFITGIGIYLIIHFLIKYPIQNIPLAILYIFLASSILSSLGIIAAFYSNSFDKLSAITSYSIVPLSFLSGTFYSIKLLPTFWYKISLVNPFFYMIDGFRYSVIGHSEANLNIGMLYLITINIILYIICYVFMKTGYKITQ